MQGRRPFLGSAAGRATSVVTRRELEERLPRSAPDALRYEPGVYVQQTAHSQGSAYIRGRTGQQTVLLFDGIRLNNSTFRQGPNQYFFTIDARTIDSIEVLRGGASTLYGSDAVGGLLNALPMQPELDPSRRWRMSPGAAFRYASADRELGGRLQLDSPLHPRVGLLGGVGFRSVGLLRAGGPVLSPRTGEAALVPRFAEDGTHQLGTDFDELAWDTRLVFLISPRLELTGAVYDYRQFDAPRTDLCPPPLAPRDECLRFEEQFRTLAYLALNGRFPVWARHARLTLSYQNQHERRLHDRPSSRTSNGGRDDVHTVGLSLRLESSRLTPTPAVGLSLLYGGDLYADHLQSAAWTTFTDLGAVVPSSRGQYLEGSSYTWGGVYLQLQADLWDRLRLRAGGRFSGVAARAPSDPESGTLAVTGTWLSGVGQGGAELRLLDGLDLLATIDRSFRAPNLDDLTSRQQTGPGFQFENSQLRPETALTVEGGLRIDLGWLEASGWLYRSWLDDAIERSPRSAADCPARTPQCAASWSRFQLVNLSSAAAVWGVEGAVRAFMPYGLSARATVAYAFGSGPDPSTGSPADRHVPLSRIPPLNGTVELRWRHRIGVYAGLGLRWATVQDRLSLADENDARIPLGGTPGFAVVDLRAGYRLDRRLVVALALENLADQAYRYHGSSVNGPGRGVVLSVEGNL